MFEVTIKTLEGVITNGPSKFETREIADTWVALQEAESRPWGHKKERWLREEQFDDETIEAAEETREDILEPEIPEHEADELDENGDPTGETIIIPMVPAVTVTAYKFAKEYVIDGPTDITETYSTEQAELAMVNAGKAARAKCELVLDYIAGYNYAQAFTQEQITTMQTLFSDVELALRANRPDLSLGAVNAATPDGVVVTEALKTKVIELLSR